MVTEVLQQIKQVPEYVLALKGAVAILAMGFPLYAGIRYFVYRRRLAISFASTLNFVSVFILFAGLAFILASPLYSHLPPAAISAYLFITCIAASFSIVSLVDVFFLQHYLVNVKKVYISPPLRVVIKISLFCIALLPILRYIAHFNPLTLIAIPTIATAGIAFALQDTLKTFIAGVGLGQVIRLGDWINYQDNEGRVIDINWARTVLEITNGQRVYVPNNLLQTGVFVNYTSFGASNRLNFQVSASYEADPTHVKETLLKCVEGVSGISPEVQPQARLLEYADSGVRYALFYAVLDHNQRVQIQDEVATRVWYAFQREGIGIPYPTRTVRLQRDRDPAKKARSHVQEALKLWGLAEAFFSEELLELSQTTRVRVFAPGEIIVKQGDSGLSMFTIIEGRVEVLLDSSPDHVVAELGPREIFGEMSLLTGDPRAGTVRAKNSVELLEIDKAGLQKLMAKRPELSDKLAELVLKRQAFLASVKNELSESNGSATGADDGPPLSARIREFFGLS